MIVVLVTVDYIASWCLHTIGMCTAISFYSVAVAIVMCVHA